MIPEYLIGLMEYPTEVLKDLRRVLVYCQETVARKETTNVWQRTCVCVAKMDALVELPLISIKSKVNAAIHTLIVKGTEGFNVVTRSIPTWIQDKRILSPQELRHLWIEKMIFDVDYLLEQKQ